MKVDKSLLSGSTPLLILSLLKDEDMYGYQMVSELAKRSDDTFQMKEGTLYPLLHSMEKEGYVRSYTKIAPSGRERKYYHLTASGGSRLEFMEKEWQVLTKQVNAVIGAAPAMG